MDKKALIKKLREIFTESNKGDRRYSIIWLSQLNYGGLYYSKDFALKLKAEHKIERYLTEIQYVFGLLREKAAEESKPILRVSIYGPNDNVEPESDDYLVFEAEPAF